MSRAQSSLDQGRIEERIVWRNMMLAVVMAVSLFGCGDENSQEARKIAAQQALDKGECGKAVTLFEALQKEDVNSVDLRLDLSAAYLCQAGFSVQGLLKVVSDFTTSTDKPAAKNSLFKTVTDQAATLIPDTALWQANVCRSKELLGTLQEDIDNTTWPCASKTEKDASGKEKAIVFNNDLDAGYILTIVNLADATLTVVDALNTVAGVIGCVSSGTATSTCQFTKDDLVSIANSLLAAQQAITGGELFEVTGNLLFNAETDGQKGLSNAEVLNYLVAQKIVKPGTVGIPANCTLDSATGKYVCA